MTVIESPPAVEPTFPHITLAGIPGHPVVVYASRYPGARLTVAGMPDEADESVVSVADIENVDVEDVLDGVRADLALIAADPHSRGRFTTPRRAFVVDVDGTTRALS